ncbi:MAG: ABC transporter permease subunit [Thermoguttaceae bacterium]|jgi:ABC-type transport system involved in multi-copper enzyme maturation permease subunit
MSLSGVEMVLFGAVSNWIKPLWVVGVGMVAALAVMLLLLYVLGLFAPKVLAIARTTAKEAMHQPLFYLILLIGVVALLIFLFLPYNTFGEDVKMVKSEGLTLIKILAVILAVWTASVSIAEEIEGRTALTLLSKPIGRRRLIFGKFLGIVIPVAIVFILLGSFFLATVSYKTTYDARESAKEAPTAEDCFNESMRVVPGLALGFMEAVILASVSVAISTRLPMMANMIICTSIYVLGHLVPLLVNSTVGNNDFVRFAGDFSAAVLPVLDHFTMETAISTDQVVSGSYLMWTGVYSLVYCVVAMLLAFLLFEDRDLA